jgi:MurNAc alpha-1-phosphate uridylyltransferase
LIDSALVLAAGLGTRMENLTKTTPKPLLPVWGKPILDHILAKVVASGVKRLMVNTFYLADQVEAYLRPWKSKVSDLIIMHEDTLQGTGGTVARACEFVENKPFFVINGDVLWKEHGGSALRVMIDHYQGRPMLACIPREKAWGYDGTGDFFIEEGCIVSKRNRHQIAPYVYGGIQIFDPAFGCPEMVKKLHLVPPFKVDQLWAPQISEKRLQGYVFPEPWYHVGTKEAFQAVGYV